MLVTVEDDADTAALIISETAITVTEAPAGNTGTYTVKLNSAPPSGETVTVTLRLSGDTTLIRVVPNSLRLTFNDATWPEPQTVTVTATADNFDTPGDGRATIEHSVSGQGGYDDVAPINVRVTVKDDDVSELVVPRSLSVSEDDGTASYSVRLSKDPGENETVTVTIARAPGDDNNAIEDPSDTLTFQGGTSSSTPPGDWNQPQTVTITGVDDEN